MYRSLQASRAVAASLVVLFHIGGSFAQDKYFGFKALDGPFAWGDSGVDFFFVLSGFLITYIHRADFGQPLALGGYVFKRTMRILPTYWLVCLAVCLAAVAVTSLRASLPDDPLTMLKALLLIPQDPAVVGGTGSPILFVAWSLQYEMLFYGVVAAFIVNRTAGTMIVVALAAVMLGCRLRGECGFALSFLSSNLVLLFAMGVASAYVAGSRHRLPRPLLVASVASVAFVAFGAFTVTHTDALPWLDKRLVFGALSSCIIVALAQAEDADKQMLKQRWIVLLGDSSYSLYLVHIPLISLMCKLLLSLGVTSHAVLVVAFVAVFLACIGIAAGFYLLVERPMLAWLGLGRRVKKSPAPPAPDPLIVGPQPSRRSERLFLTSR